jgi:hypothetical protein
LPPRQALGFLVGDRLLRSQLPGYGLCGEESDFSVALGKRLLEMSSPQARCKKLATDIRVAH